MGALHRVKFAGPLKVKVPLLRTAPAFRFVWRSERGGGKDSIRYKCSRATSICCTCRSLACLNTVVLNDPSIVNLVKTNSCYINTISTKALQARQSSDSLLLISMMPVLNEKPLDRSDCSHGLISSISSPLWFHV